MDLGFRVWVAKIGFVYSCSLLGMPAISSLLHAPGQLPILSLRVLVLQHHPKSFCMLCKAPTLLHLAKASPSTPQTLEPER